MPTEDELHARVRLHWDDEVSRVDAASEWRAFEGRVARARSGGRWRRSVALGAVAAAVGIVAVVFVARSASDPEIRTIDTGGVDSRVAPATSSPTSSSGQTSIVSTTSDPLRETTSTIATTSSTEPGPSDALLPVDGVVSLDATTLGTRRFDRRGTLAQGSDAAVSRLDIDRFVATTVGNGVVTVFDVDGASVGGTVLPLALDGLDLRSIAIGADLVVYGLYAGSDRDLVVAWAMTEARPELGRWTTDPCDGEYCDLERADDGIRWGTERVPYLDRTGAEVSFTPVASPSFRTTYEPSDGSASPTSVRIEGPIGEPTSWRIDVQNVRFDADLYRAFERQPDRSLAGMVGVATPNGPVRRLALWMIDGGRVVVVDDGAVPGLRMVFVDRAGMLRGVTVNKAGAIQVGLLTPPN